MRARELIRILRGVGCVPLRSHGDHVLLRSPHGRWVLSIPQGGRNTFASPGLLGAVRRILRREGSACPF